MSYINDMGDSSFRLQLLLVRNVVWDVAAFDYSRGDRLFKKGLERAKKEDGVEEALCLPGGALVGKGGLISRQRKRFCRPAAGSLVIGMAVPTEWLKGDNDMRLMLSYQANQFAQDLNGVSLYKGSRAAIFGRARHTRVTVVEKDRLLDTENRAGIFELFLPYGAKCLRRGQGGIADFSSLATCGADEGDFRAAARIHGERATDSPFVIGMSEYGHYLVHDLYFLFSPAILVSLFSSRRGYYTSAIEYSTARVLNSENYEESHNSGRYHGYWYKRTADRAVVGADNVG